MSATPRRIVTGHDASGRSVVLSDAPTPKTLDIGSAAFHEIWITDRAPSPIAAGEPEPTETPLLTPPPPARGARARAARSSRAHPAARGRGSGAVHRDGAGRGGADAPHRDGRRRR